MGRSGADPIQRLMNLMFKAHPWHGVSMGDKAPEVVTAYIEIVPTDTREVRGRQGQRLPQGGSSATLLQFLSGVLWPCAADLLRRESRRLVFEARQTEGHDR